jgi:AcrR family transcriptional regulator
MPLDEDSFSLVSEIHPQPEKKIPTMTPSPRDTAQDESLNAGRPEPTATTVPTVQAILDAAIKNLDEHGVAGFRISKVLEEAHASQGSLRHHFSDREGLIRAAEFERFFRLAISEPDEQLRIVDQIATNDEFCDFIALQLTRLATDPDIVRIRKSRISVYANALERAELLTSIMWLQDGYLAAQADVLKRAQERGIINPELDPYDYVAFFHGLALGRTFSEFNVDEPERWLAIAIPAATAPLRIP